MDYEEAISEALVAMRKSNPTNPNADVTVSYDVMYALTHPGNHLCKKGQPHVDEDTQFVVPREGPAIWYVGTDGIAYNLDMGPQEIPRSGREQEVAVSLLGYARKLIWAER